MLQNQFQYRRYSPILTLQAGRIAKAAHHPKGEDHMTATYNFTRLAASRDDLFRFSEDIAAAIGGTFERGFGRYGEIHFNGQERKISPHPGDNRIICVGDVHCLSHSRGDVIAQAADVIAQAVKAITTKYG